MEKRKLLYNTSHVALYTKNKMKTCIPRITPDILVIRGR